jgi:effector-binding domain-containing protein
MPRLYVQRSGQIDASTDRVFEAVADFGTWTRWSPWLCVDPDAQVDITPHAASVGSVYSWKGELVGEGEIEHLRLVPGQLIEEQLRFVKPFRSQAYVTFGLEPAGEGTKITWTMEGSLPWFLFWMRGQMERFVGMDYERGLKMLKEWIETGTVLSRTTIRGVEPVGPLRMAGVRETCSIRDIGASMESSFCRATEELGRYNLPTDGQIISVYHKMDLKARTFDYTSGLIIPEAAGPLPEELASWSIPATKAVAVEHVGSYDHLGNAWNAGFQYVHAKKLKPGKGAPYEIYVNCPDETAPADLRTEVFIPLK